MLRFDPMTDEDERAAHVAREQLVEWFGRWLQSHPGHESADAWDVDLLLSSKFGYATGTTPVEPAPTSTRCCSSTFRAS